MLNDYEIKEEITIIFIKSHKYGLLKTLIDTEDLERVKKGTSWCVSWNEDVQSFYVRGYLVNKITKEREPIQLHRYLMKVTDPDKHVDHIFHDTLDNRKSKLRIVSNAENHQNRRKQKNNTSGVPGVSFRKDVSKWRARIIKDKKEIHLGYFNKKEDAVIARKKAEFERFHYKREISS